MALWSCPQPVVCRLNGPARAGGVGLLASCDLVVARSEVTFSFTEVRLGLVPAIITVPLLRRIAPQALHRLFLTGEVFSAERAQEIGLLDAVAAPGDLDAEVARMVGMLMRGGPAGARPDQAAGAGDAFSARPSKRLRPPGHAFRRAVRFSRGPRGHAVLCRET